VKVEEKRGLPSIGKPSVRSLYLNIPTSVSFVCYFLGYILEVMDTSMKTDKLSIVKNWATQQLHLADGRFAKDKTWCFFALNYAERRRNMTQGRWFVKNLINDEDVPHMETLKEKLRNNDTKFIEKLQYFARLVPGSNSYWRN
jgi:hypothetical protein